MAIDPVCKMQVSIENKAAGQERVQRKDRLLLRFGLQGQVRREPSSDAEELMSRIMALGCFVAAYASKQGRGATHGLFLGNYRARG